jgi:hypothetical protein
MATATPIEQFEKGYTNTYWVQFADGRRGCMTVDPDEDPVAVAKTLGAPTHIDSLPYPAQPILRQRPNPGKYGHCPDFCYSPEQCKGRTSCPKNYACSE